MIIKELLEQLETSNHPVAKPLRKGEHFKVVAIGFKKGMVLKEHKTALPAKLIVLAGSVLYKEGTISKTLHQYDETEIPEHVLHAVECIEDALCMLIQG